MPGSSLSNPWLAIPLDDYERHMALPSVGQAQLLSELLAEAIAKHRPRSIAVLGCAGGNGFDRVPPSVERLVGVDINADYVAAARRRFAGRSELELHVADLERDEPPFAAVELVYAALLFEYVAPARVLPTIAAKLVPGGALVAALQLPSSAAAVTPSPYSSLRALADVLTLRAPADLQAAAAAVGLTAQSSTTRIASGGKELGVLCFVKA